MGASRFGRLLCGIGIHKWRQAHRSFTLSAGGQWYMNGWDYCGRCHTTGALYEAMPVSSSYVIVRAKGKA